MKNQNGNIPLIIITAVLILVAGWYFLIHRGGWSITSGPTPVPTGYQSPTDLDNALKHLDAVNLNQMDTGINRVAEDSSSF